MFHTSTMHRELIHPPTQHLNLCQTTSIVNENLQSIYPKRQSWCPEKNRIPFPPLKAYFESYVLSLMFVQWRRNFRLFQARFGHFHRSEPYLVKLRNLCRGDQEVFPSFTDSAYTRGKHRRQQSNLAIHQLRFSVQRDRSYDNSHYKFMCWWCASTSD